MSVIEDTCDSRLNFEEGLYKALNGMIRSGEYHWFTSSALNWRTGTDLAKVLASQKRADTGPSSFQALACNIWIVPLPDDAKYSINNYAPEVDGAIWLGNNVYDVKEKK